MKSITRSLGRRLLALPVLLVATTAFAHAAPQETAAKEGRETERSAGTAVKDSWITLKVHSQFVPEEALEGSDIDVNTKAGVVTLSGTVASQAGRTRALAIAKATDGVKNVSDRLRIARADADRSAAQEDDRDSRADAAEAGRTAREGGRETAEEAREAGRTTREAGREAREEAREGRPSRDTAAGTTGTSGSGISDGWIKSKIAAQFVTENALDDSDINITVRRGVVTLNGAVPTAAGRTRAEAIVKSTDGVRSVNNRLKVAPEAK